MTQDQDTKTIAGNRPLPSSKNPHFQNEARCTAFLVKRVLFAWEWKMISVSKAEHVTSFWNRGPEELGNGLLTYNNISSWHYCTFNALLVGVFCSSSPINESNPKYNCTFARYSLVKFNYFSLYSLSIFLLVKRLPVVNFETYHRNPQIRELSDLIIRCVRNAWFPNQTCNVKMCSLPRCVFQSSS